jgi:Leucine-rich repeat (LRR) protein
MSSSNPRRWLQFRLRTLLIGVTLAALPLGYVAWEREQCRRGEAARAMIYRNSGRDGFFSPEDFDEVLVSFTETESPHFPRPEWLKDILGNDRFRLLVSAYLQGDALADADLARLEALPNLRKLSIADSNVTAEGVANLRGLNRLKKFSFEHNGKASDARWEILSGWKQLRELSFDGSDFRDASVPCLAPLVSLKQLQISNTKITDAGLAAFPPLTTLECLDLSGTEVSDDGLQFLSRLTNLRKLRLEDTKFSGLGLRHLVALPHLESLALYGSKVTDDGLASVEGFTSLEGLGLSQTAVTDEALAHVGRLTSLKRLGLGDTQITNRGLYHLGRLTNLETLDLSNTKISDDGVIHLRSLSNLKKIYLFKTNVTEAGERKLVTLLPKLSIARVRDDDPFRDSSRPIGLE